MASTLMPLARILSTRSSGYLARPAMTGIGSICWVLVTIWPVGFRYSIQRAASSSSKETMKSASPLSMMGE